MEETKTPGEVAEKAANDLGRFLKKEIDETTVQVAEEAATFAPSTGLLVVAGVTGFLGAELLVFSPVVAHPGRAIAIGSALCLLAGFSAYAAFQALPERPRRAIETAGLP